MKRTYSVNQSEFWAWETTETEEDERIELQMNFIKSNELQLNLLSLAHRILENLQKKKKKIARNIMCYVFFVSQSKVNLLI